MSASGTKRTNSVGAVTSANDPKRTFRPRERWGPLAVIRLNGGGPRPQTLSSLKARHLVPKRPKKKLSHLYFGPVGGGERQDLIGQPRPSASFVERRQFKNAFADQLFPNVIKNGF